MSDGQLSPAAVPRRKLGIRIRRFRGEILVASDEEAFELADSAEFIFTRIDGGHSVGDIARSLAQEYGIDERVATDDTVEFLTWLLDNEFIEIDAAQIDAAPPDR